MPDILFLLRSVHLLCAVLWLGFAYALLFVMRPAGRRLAPTLSGPKDPRISFFAGLVLSLLKGYRAGSWGTVGLGFAIFFYRLNTVQGDPSARSALLKSDWGLWVMTGMTLGLVMAALAWMIVDPGLSAWARSLPDEGWKPVPKKVVSASWINAALSVLTLAAMVGSSHGGFFSVWVLAQTAVLAGIVTGGICFLAARCSEE